MRDLMRSLTKLRTARKKNFVETPRHDAAECRIGICQNLDRDMGLATKIGHQL